MNLLNFFCKNPFKSFFYSTKSLKNSIVKFSYFGHQAFSVTRANDDNLMLFFWFIAMKKKVHKQTIKCILTHPSIKGTSFNTFLTISIRSANCTVSTAPTKWFVHIDDNKLMIIVVKHKPHNFRSSVDVRFRRRISLPPLTPSLAYWLLSMIFWCINFESVN